MYIALPFTLKFKERVYLGQLGVREQNPMKFYAHRPSLQQFEACNGMPSKSTCFIIRVCTRATQGLLYYYSEIQDQSSLIVRWQNIQMFRRITRQMAVDTIPDQTYVAYSMIRQVVALRALVSLGPRSLVSMAGTCYITCTLLSNFECHEVHELVIFTH